MEQKKLIDFIVIDDDETNNLICSKMLELTFPEAGAQTFTRSQDGIDHIVSYDNMGGERSLVVFLDINMPFVNGWEVLEQFMELQPEVREGTRIFMLSSSIWPDDREKVSQYPFVSGFVSKPLTQSGLQTLFPEL